MEKSKVIENLKRAERYMGMPEQGCKWTPNASTIAIEEAINSLEKLSRYEATGLEPEEILTGVHLTGVQLAEIACLQIRYKKRQELLERAAECIRGCYGRETELSEAIRKEIN